MLVRPGCCVSNTPSEGESGRLGRLQRDDLVYVIDGPLVNAQVVIRKVALVVDRGSVRVQLDDLV